MNWKEFKHKEKLYRVSYCGTIEEFKDKWIPVPSYIGSRGYLVCKLGLVHRIVAIHHVSNPLNLPQVNHKDFDKCNSHAGNLEWVTAKQNTEHAIHYNRKNSGISIGSANGLSKLTELEVIEIKRLFGKIKNYEIAKIYNVAPCTISDIKRGATWKHV